MSRAEEVGLRGSQAIAESYYQQNKVVVGMMQLDMTFYPGGPQPVVGIMVGTSAITRHERPFARSRWLDSHRGGCELYVCVDAQTT